jgi:transporter family protein
MQWLVYALIATFFWGFWGFIPKLVVSKKFSPESFLIYECIGTILVTIFVLIKVKGKVDLGHIPAASGIVAGASAVIGTLFFIKALEIGESVPVIIITALYPVVILALCYFFLQEKLTIRHGLAVCFGLAAIVLLSYDPQTGDKKIEEEEAVVAPSDAIETASNKVS